MEEESLFYGSTAAMTARHFPAFAACGRTGGGFRLEGHHSNSAYNCHIINLKPRCHSSCSRSSRRSRSLSPEHLNAMAYSSLKHAAAVSSSISVATGVWSHVFDNSIPSAAEAFKAGAEAYSTASTVPPPTLACKIQHLVGPEAASAAAAACPYSCEHPQSDIGCSMPTTFYSSKSSPHSLWQHDGTDFTRGHLEQGLSRRRPVSAGARSTSNTSLRQSSTRTSTKQRIGSNCCQHPNSSSGSSRRPHSASPSPPSNRLMQRTRQHWAENQYRPSRGHVSEEISALMSRPRCSADRSSWFSHTPVQVLKIERERQQAAEEAWLAQFHPTEEAKYPNRSAALHKYQQEHQQQQQQRFEVSGDVRAQVFKLEASRYAMQDEEARNMPVQVERQQQQGKLFASGLQWLHTNATTTAAQEQQQQQEAEVEEEGPGCNGTDGLIPPTVSELDVRATVINSAVECAAARSAAAAAASERDKPKPAWWHADARLAERVNTLLQPNSAALSAFSNISREEYSATLGLYDSLIAANAAGAVQLQAEDRFHGSTVLQKLRTPEQMHAVWVGELSSRPVAVRQHQALIEAAIANAAQAQ